MARRTGIVACIHRYITGLLLLALCVVAFAATDEDRPLVTPVLAGNLTVVNAGEATAFKCAPIDARTMVGALGLATMKKDRALGDMISFAGRTFIRSTDPKTGVKIIETPGPFLAPFYLGIPDGQTVFPRVVRIDAAEPQLLHAMLEEMAKAAQSPIAVLGWVDAPDVNGIALKRAPIEGDSLNGSNKNDYLDTISQRTAHLVFVAVVVPPMTVNTVSNYRFSRVLFDFDTTQGQPAAALIHVHGALVAQAAPPDFATAPLMLKSLQDVTVSDVLHVYGSSTIQRGTAIVYRLQYPGVEQVQPMCLNQPGM